MQRLSIKSTLVDAWIFTKKAFPWLFLIQLIIGLLFIIAFELLTPYTNESSFFIIIIIFSLLALLSTFCFSANSVKIMLKLWDGEKVYFSDLFKIKDVKLHFNYLITVILSGIIIMLGIILFIIPGIVLSLILLLVGYLAYDKKLKPVQAIKESYRLTLGHKGQILLIGIITMIPLYVLSSLINLVIPTNNFVLIGVIVDMIFQCILYTYPMAIMWTIYKTLTK